MDRFLSRSFPKKDNGTQYMYHNEQWFESSSWYESVYESNVKGKCASMKSCIRWQTRKQIRIIRIYMNVRWFVIVARTIYEMLMTSTNILKRPRIVISLFCGQKRYPSKLQINPYFSDKARQFNFPRMVIGGLMENFRFLPWLKYSVNVLWIGS